MTPEVFRQNKQIWHNLGAGGDSTLNLRQLFNFLTQQGLNIESEEECVVSRDNIEDAIILSPVLQN